MKQILDLAERILESNTTLIKYPHGLPRKDYETYFPIVMKITDINILNIQNLLTELK